MLWLLSPPSLFLSLPWPGVGGPCLEGLLSVAKEHMAQQLTCVCVAGQ